MKGTNRKKLLDISQNNVIFLAGKLNDLEDKKKLTTNGKSRSGRQRCQTSKAIDSDEIHAIKIKIIEAQNNLNLASQNHKRIER